MNSFFDYSFLGNPMKDWLICLGVIAVSMTAARIFQRLIIKRLQKLSEKTSTRWDDFVVSVIRRFVMPLVYLYCIYFGLTFLSLPEMVDNALRIASVVVAVYFVIRAINAFIRQFFYSYLGDKASEQEKRKQLRGILLIIQGIVWLTGILFLIDNLGYDITTIAAGLGIGGIAIALASQAILGDLFSYLVIFFDKPFEIGDFIILEDKLGTVEYIGIKTTRVRSLSGEQLIFSNTDLTNSRLRNFKSMDQRRVLFSIGVVYGTPYHKLKRIPGMVEEIIRSEDNVRFDRAHFFSYGDFSLNFEIVYYVLSADYNEYMDRQQSINLKLFERFEKEHIDFAFPTQTLIFERNNLKELQQN